MSRYNHKLRQRLALDVLTLYNESDFAFVEFTPFSFNLVMEASAENVVLESQRCPSIRFFELLHRQFASVCMHERGELFLRRLGCRPEHHQYAL